MPLRARETTCFLEGRADFPDCMTFLSFLTWRTTFDHCLVHVTSPFILCMEVQPNLAPTIIPLL